MESKEHITYSHFAKPADVWKHLALCEVLDKEQPTVYVETNSACAEYRLTGTPEQQYGIYHFINAAKRDRRLLDSLYYQLESKAVAENRYLGSPGLAMSILGKSAGKLIFYDIEATALINIIQFAEQHSVDDKIDVIQQDSIVGTLDLLPRLPQSAFVHIDPYLINQPSSNGYDYMDVFVRASEKGLKCLLWYGFNTLEEKQQLGDFMRSKLLEQNIDNLSCIELIMDVIRQESIPCNPGILGSGLLMGNLSPEVTGKILTYSGLLVDLYQDSMYNGCNGSIYRDIVDLNSNVTFK